MNRFLHAAWILALSGCLAAPSATQLLGGAAVGTGESAAERQAAAMLEARYGGIVEDGAMERRLADTLAQLRKASPELPADCRCRVLESATCNAFSVPGRLYVTRGLYVRLDEPDLVAAAVAHECAHLVRQDSLKPRCADDDEALEREMIADRAAAGYLRRGGYDATAMRRLILLVEDQQPEGWAQRRVQRLGG